MVPLVLVEFRGIERLPVARVSLLGLISPIVATTAGWLVLGQTLTPVQGTGAVLVLSALWLGQRPARDHCAHGPGPRDF